MPLNWVELWGFELPDLLHAMQLKRLPGLGFYGSYLG
jgi:hypothetical protein